MHKLLLALGVAIALQVGVPMAALAQRGGTEFSELRAAIGAHAPERLQQPFLAKVEVAERKLPPNPCVSLHALGALRNQVEAKAGEDDFSAADAEAVMGAIAFTERVYLPPGPCGRG